MVSMIDSEPTSDEDKRKIERVCVRLLEFYSTGKDSQICGDEVLVVFTSGEQISIANHGLVSIEKANEAIDTAQGSHADLKKSMAAAAITEGMQAILVFSKSRIIVLGFICGHCAERY